VEAALTAAAEQLSRSRAARKVAVLLSDCRATAHGSGQSEALVRVAAAARRLDELVIVAPESDDVEAQLLAAMTGSRITTVSGPSDAVAALARVLDR
jgi:Mg-chelatase subunit ChlD